MKNGERQPVLCAFLFGRKRASHLRRVAWFAFLYGAAILGLALVCISLGFAGELKINVTSFPPGQPLKPGTAVLLSVEGLEPGQTATWHRVDVEGDIVLKLDGYHLFAGTAAGPRTFIVQVASPGADPFTIATFNYGEADEEEDDDDVNPPIPPVPPVPPGEKLVVIVQESKNPDAVYVLVEAHLIARLTSSGQDYRSADPDQKEDGKTPAWLKVVLDRAEADGVVMPVLAVVADDSGDYSVVAVKPLPDKLEAASFFLRQNGVE